MMKKQFLFLLAFAALVISCQKEPSPDPTPTIPSCSLPAGGENIVMNAEFYQHLFDSANPEVEESALDPLIEYLAKARIVGLGEATHGSQEFYQMKDKIFRQLVMKKNFKAIVFELPWGNCQLVDDYVFKNERSLEEVVAQIPYWVYKTQEVADLIEWMHDYNLNKPDEEKIHFWGNDPQGGDFTVEKRIVIDFIEISIPDSLSFVRNAFSLLPSDLFEGNYDETNSIHDFNQKGIQSVLDFMRANATALIDAGGKEKFDIALLATEVIAGREEVYRTRNHGLLRDRLMAEFSESWLELLGADAKIALWAHNFHVSNINFSDTNKSMGHFLKATYARGYQIVAFGFARGGVNALLTDANFNFIGGLGRHEVDQIVCNSVNHFVSETAGDNKYFIFEEIAVGDVFYEFMVRTQDFLSIGSGFNPAFLDRHFYQPRQVLRENDVLIFFDEVRESELR